MAQWQRTTPNFSGANGALAVASNSFTKAGGLATQLANSLRQRDMAEAKKAAMQTAAINDSRKTEYLLNADNRKVAMEQYQHDLNTQRVNNQNNQILSAQQAAMPQAKDKLKAAFEQQINTQVAPITGVEVGQSGPARPNTTGQNLTPEQIKQNMQLEQVNRNSQTASNNFDKLNPKVARQDLYQATLDSLVKQNTGLPLETLQAKANEYVNQQLGAMPSKDMIDNQLAGVDKTYETKSNLLKEMMKSMTSSKNTPNVNVSIGSNGVNSTGDIQSVTTSNDPMQIDKWIKTVIGDEDNSGVLDTVFQWGSDDQAIDADDLKTAVQFYKKNFPQLSNNQIMSYLGNEVKAGRASDYYGNDKIFPDSADAKVNADQVKFAQDMQKYGADKSSSRVKGFGADGKITDVKAAKAILGEKYKQYAQLMKEQEALDKEYASSRSAITRSLSPKSREQLASDLVQKYVMPIAQKEKVDPKEVKVAVKKENISKTKLFSDTANPISAAMRTNDKKGKSSLIKLLDENPNRYAEAFKKLTKPEKASVVKYLQSSKFKKLASEYKPKNTNDTEDTATSLLSKNLPKISVGDLPEGYDTVAMYKKGYVPEYNAAREVIGWRNPRLEHAQKLLEQKAAANRLGNIANPTGSTTFGFGSSEPSQPTAAELYQRGLLNR